jgi:hypothetical protein
MKDDISDIVAICKLPSLGWIGLPAVNLCKFLHLSSLGIR